MALRFNLDDVRITEFGVGIDTDDGQQFVQVPINNDVQIALEDMARDTWELMETKSKSPSTYDPSDKHASQDHLVISLDEDVVSHLRDLHGAKNLPSDTSALDDPSNVFCYFARMTDDRERKLTALRRATQFKGILKSKNRLVRWLDDSLQIIEDTVFKLDNDFDLLIDSHYIHILRPSAFEFVGHLQEEILNAVPKNIREIRTDLSFVNLDNIKEFASKHPRAARYLASICAQDEAKNIDKSALKRLCTRTGVEVRESGGKLIVDDGHEMGFLEVLDRRRYELELVDGEPERFRAASRQKLPD
jgi:hypothetical protein